MRFFISNSIYHYMNLQEQILRTKELMGLQPLNEGQTKSTGKLTDFISKVFKKNSNEIVTDPYETKYGSEYMNLPSTIISYSANKQLNKQLNNTNADSSDIFVNLGIVTQDQQSKLKTDMTKSFYTVCYSLIFNKNTNSQIKTYQYFKCEYIVDGVVADQIVNINNSGEVCTSSTLDKTSGCQLSDEILNEIKEVFKDDNQLISNLGKIK